MSLSCVCVSNGTFCTTVLPVNLKFTGLAFEANTVAMRSVIPPSTILPLSVLQSKKCSTPVQRTRGLQHFLWCFADFCHRILTRQGTGL
jgi:hypothetical protein